MKNSILKPIFWDLDAEKLNPQRHAYQIIDRILEYGNTPQVYWMFKTYPKEKIIEVVKHSRQLSPKSANFWAIYYNLPRDEVRCIVRQLQKEQKVLWPY